MLIYLWKKKLILIFYHLIRKLWYIFCWLYEFFMHISSIFFLRAKFRGSWFFSNCVISVKMHNRKKRNPKKRIYLKTIFSLQSKYIIQGTDDPFGDDFEESLKTAPQIPIKRVSRYWNINLIYWIKLKFGVSVILKLLLCPRSFFVNFLGGYLKPP